MSKAISKPGKMLPSPGDHTLIMIDFQSHKSIDAVTFLNNAALVANADALTVVTARSTV